MTTEQQIGALQADVENVKDDISEIKGDVREMRDILMRAQGSWKTLVILGTISAALGALITKAAAWLLPLIQK